MTRGAATAALVLFLAAAAAVSEADHASTAPGNAPSAKMRQRILSCFRGRPALDETAAPDPSHAEVSYGPHRRNVFDFWQADTAGPAPLLVYIHGGGFTGGDKRTLNPRLLCAMLEQRISVAAVNYRLAPGSPYPAPMQDCARAIQFLRFHAGEYNLDPGRVAVTGGSAGGGISLWLAFHEDLAQPGAPDPVARQSTRVRTAAVRGAQTSYDPRVLMDLFKLDTVDPRLMALFGMRSEEDIESEAFQRLFQDASPINHLNAGDPPVFLVYTQPETPITENMKPREYTHHPIFGRLLEQQMGELGIPCVMRVCITPEARAATFDAQEVFLLRYLRGLR